MGEFVINGENLELRKVADGAEERMGGLVGSIALTLLTNMIKDIVTETVLGMLGITTTPDPRPPGPLAGLIDLLLPDAPTTTTQTTTAAPTTTTTTPAPTTTTTTPAPTTTTQETTSKCGGL